MYTGIVQEIGEVVEVESRDEIIRYAISFPHSGLDLGASVSIDGVCQTVIRVDDAVWFEATAETCTKSTIGKIAKGDQVNVERSVKFGDEIGGHIVAGHVSGMIKLANVDGNVYTFSCPNTDYLFDKGFVALNGASLTVCDVKENTFKINFIPETFARTTFSSKKPGDLINIEYDPMTQTIVETVKRIQSR